MLRVEIERKTPAQALARLIGRLDTQTYRLCEEHLEPLLGPATKALALDLSQLDYMSSMGLRVIMNVSKRLARQGGKCAVLGPQPGVRAVLEIAKALPDQNIFASVAEADQYFDAIQKQAKETSSGA
jgi:anti-sigma B factor antagonist